MATTVWIHSKTTIQLQPSLYPTVNRKFDHPTSNGFLQACPSPTSTAPWADRTAYMIIVSDSSSVWVAAPSSSVNGSSREDPWVIAVPSWTLSATAASAAVGNKTDTSSLTSPAKPQHLPLIIPNHHLKTLTLAGHFRGGCRHTCDLPEATRGLMWHIMGKGKQTDSWGAICLWRMTRDFGILEALNKGVSLSREIFI